MEEPKWFATEESFRRFCDKAAGMIARGESLARLLYPFGTHVGGSAFDLSQGSGGGNIPDSDTEENIDPQAVGRLLRGIEAAKVDYPKVAKDFGAEISKVEIGLKNLAK